jgi:predicted restriction endonuclease
MQKHIKTYLEYYWLDQNNISCEVCGLQAVDIHHIEARSKFGKKTKHLQDIIQNIIALCRNCHQNAHWQWTNKLSKLELQTIHNNNLKNGD